MQNLSISCSLVCLIILGSAALLGAFGVFQRQISAILVTGVMYLLAGEHKTINISTIGFHSFSLSPSIMRSFVCFVHIDDSSFETTPRTIRCRFRWHRRGLYIEKRRWPCCPTPAQCARFQHIVELGSGLGRCRPLWHHICAVDNAIENYAL